MDIDIYEEYPELRELKPRRTTAKRRRKRGMSSNGKLGFLIVAIALILFLATVVVPRLLPKTEFVYNRDGSVMEIKADKKAEFISNGWFENLSDTFPVTLYAEDGSCITALRADVKALEKSGYYADKSKAFTTMYSESGETLYVPNNMTSAYEAKGWKSKISAVTKTLYKTDGSKITVMNSEVEKYVKEGWKARLLDAAKKMVSPEGKEEFVFKDDVNDYIAQGWSVVKRVVDPDQPMIALTFDDGPGKYTDKLLDCLEKNNSVATFYVVGYLAKAYPEVISREDKLGCEVANHTWEHISLTSQGAAAGAEAVEKTSNQVKEIIGKPTKTYRPVGGAYNDSILSAIDMPAIIWSLDTLDWKTRNADSTYDKIIKNVKDGDIILMHDIYEQTVEAACRAIPKLIEEGYQLVSVSELLEYRKGGARAHEVYFNAYPD